MKKKICFFTGTRAEYGLVRPLMQKIKDESEFQIQIIASGMHMSPEFGLTYREIEQDGFTINEKVEILLSSDTDIGVAKAMGLGLISFSDSLKRLNPNILIVLGDRFETFSAAISAYVMKTPVVHLYGGETTEGALDEGFRHSITKMSYLHFTSTEEYRKRVIQLGENPERVFNVGAIGLDNIRKLKLLNVKTLEKDLNLNFGEKNILFTYHPVTLEKDKLNNELHEIFGSLEELINQGYTIIITKSNADQGGRFLNHYIDDFSLKHKGKVFAYTNLGTTKYLSVMKHVNLVMGNSSSGIIEAPSFKIPTVNIGDRQKGRVRGNSIIDVKPVKDEILYAIKLAENIDKNKIINPYDQDETTEKIYCLIKNHLENDKINLKKKFFDINFKL